jgi:ribosomal protein L20
MARVKRGVVARRRHKKILKLAKATTERVRAYSALPSRR